MEVIKFLQSFATPLLDKVFIGITILGEDYFFILIVALFFWCIRKDWGYRLGIAYLGSAILNLTLKDIFRVPRPIGQPGIRSLRLETAEGFSFPSGHTQSITVLTGTMAIWFKKNWLYFVSALLIILVAVSRMYLGVHTPVDVIGGAAIGIAWTLGMNWLFDFVESRPGGQRKMQIILLLLGFFILLGLWFFSGENYCKASGAVLGLLTGYFVEPRFIKYEPKSQSWTQGVKYISGIVILLGIEVIGKKLLPDRLISHFFRYYLMSIWVTILAPWLFKAVFRENNNNNEP